MFLGKWIKANEQLPDTNQEVLVCTTNNKVVKTTRIGNRWKGSGTFNDGVVYWMPIPKPPELVYGKYNFEDDFFGAVINCAVRYALGRQSYMPSLVIGEVRNMLPLLNDKTVGCMERDIREAAELDRCGDETIDKPLWLGLLKELQEVMNERSIERWQ